MKVHNCCHQNKTRFTGFRSLNPLFGENFPRKVIYDIPNYNELRYLQNTCTKSYEHSNVT